MAREATQETGPDDHDPAAALDDPVECDGDEDEDEGHVTKGTERALAVEHWLLVSADDRMKARDEWRHQGIALLRCGTLFCAVRFERRVVEAAAGTEDTEKLDRFLAEVLHGGPVFMDQTSERYYALVPPSAGKRSAWSEDRNPLAQFLGAGHFLGVPRPTYNDGHEERTYWSVPMESAGDLCPPEALSQLLTVGYFNLVQKDAVKPVSGIGRARAAQREVRGGAS